MKPFYRVSLVSLSACALFAISPAVAEDHGEPADGIPELKHLDQFAGQWEGTTADGEATSESTTRWVLGGRFVKQEYSTEAANGETGEGFIMRGYDPNGRRYIMTLFDSSGSALMLTGTYDEEENEFVFEAPLGNGIVMRSTSRFTENPPTEHWDIASYQNDNRLGGMSGKNVRQKE